jgi:hypothetical protein
MEVCLETGENHKYPSHESQQQGRYFNNGTNQKKKA